MAGCHYEILHSELQGFDVYRTMDIRFMFAAQVNRQMTFRLAFFAKAAAEIPLLIKLFGDEVADANQAVVSFYNLEAQDNPDCDMFDRPPAAAALTLHETLFFYASLIDIILQVARRENIQLLTFQAYTPQLIKVYDRLVRQQAGPRNLRVFKEGANYVLQTDN
ncbi:hypothetical protein [Erwinia persicina]|uniref:hypothetical protein n=1 Tax=Erwinia persicina TaxID=55211 RepID=UPI00209ECF7E|nr:hypothetical protein [Erwinia persicina]